MFGSNILSRLFLVRSADLFGNPHFNLSISRDERWRAKVLEGKEVLGCIVRVFLGNDACSNLDSDIWDVRVNRQQIDCRHSFHQHGFDEHADQPTQRIPVGAERSDRGLGLFEEDPETARRKSYC